MLTKKQYELINYISRRLQETGVSPSFDEMKVALRLKSKSGIHRLITGLEERGFIRRLPHRARALEVLKLPDDNIYGNNSNNKTNVIKADFGSSPSPADDVHEIPLLGKIAAGAPIEAITNPTTFIDIPSCMCGREGRYALTIEGDSMIDAGINDGDTVVIEKCQEAANGSIVVALIDDAEATLKRIRKKGDSIALEPANKDYEIRIFGPDRVKIQGKLVGLIRTYH